MRELPSKIKRHLFILTRCKTLLAISNKSCMSSSPSSSSSYIRTDSEAVAYSSHAVTTTDRHQPLISRCAPTLPRTVRTEEIQPFLHRATRLTLSIPGKTTNACAMRLFEGRGPNIWKAVVDVPCNLQRVVNKKACHWLHSTTRCRRCGIIGLCLQRAVI